MKSYVACFVKMSVGTINVPEFSLCFLKLFLNLKHAYNNAANAPEVIGLAGGLSLPY
jgi:hypothetical protein